MTRADVAWQHDRRVARAAIICLRLVVLLGCAMGWCAPGAARDGQPRIATLIGNEQYAPRVGPLKTPHADVVLLERALKAVGFEVGVVRDATRLGLRSAVEHHIERVGQAGAGAVSLFYFAGHGLANTATRVNYLLPVDVADVADPDLWRQLYSQSDVIDQIAGQGMDATHLVIFDASRAELRLTAAQRQDLGLAPGFVAVGDTDRILVAYSTAPLQAVSESWDSGGPFARTLAAEIVKPGVDAVAVFRRVKLRLRQEAGLDPWLSVPSLPVIHLAGRAPEQAATPGGRGGGAPGSLAAEDAVRHLIETELAALPPVPAASRSVAIMTDALGHVGAGEAVLGQLGRLALANSDFWAEGIGKCAEGPQRIMRGMFVFQLMYFLAASRAETGGITAVDRGIYVGTSVFGPPLRLQDGAYRARLLPALPLASAAVLAERLVGIVRADPRLRRDMKALAHFMLQAREVWNAVKAEAPKGYEARANWAAFDQWLEKVLEREDAVALAPDCDALRKGFVYSYVAKGPGLPAKGLDFTLSPRPYAISFWARRSAEGTEALAAGLLELARARF